MHPLLRDHEGMSQEKNQPEKSEFLKRLDILVSEAIADAVARDRKLGAPIYILRDGQVVDISNELPEPPQSIRPLLRDNDKINQEKNQHEPKPEVLSKMSVLAKQAIAEAIEVNRKLGAPIYILRDGKVVDISNELPEPPQS
jgi:predicted heme/steroid binding protein